MNKLIPTVLLVTALSGVTGVEFVEMGATHVLTLDPVPAKMPDFSVNDGCIECGPATLILMGYVHKFTIQQALKNI
jgi:hypothetical protein